jgi:hypothetical protein
MHCTAKLARCSSLYRSSCCTNETDSSPANQHSPRRKFVQLRGPIVVSYDRKVLSEDGEIANW